MHFTIVDVPGRTINCSAGRHCPNGRIFHLTCLDMDEDDVPDDEWWCCNQCEEYSAYCCQRNIPDALWIGCENLDKCLLQ